MSRTAAVRLWRARRDGTAVPCVICGRSFIRIATHMTRTHGSPPVPKHPEPDGSLGCPFCNRGNFRNLSLHLSRTHRMLRSEIHALGIALVVPELSTLCSERGRRAPVFCGCGNRAHARGLCYDHYLPVQAAERRLPFVDQSWRAPALREAEWWNTQNGLAMLRRGLWAATADAVQVTNDRPVPELQALWGLTRYGTYSRLKTLRNQGLIRWTSARGPARKVHPV